MEYYLHPNMVKKSPLRWDEIFLLYSRTALWFANSTADPLGSAASLAINFVLIVIYFHAIAININVKILPIKES